MEKDRAWWARVGRAAAPAAAARTAAEPGPYRPGRGPYDSHSNVLL
jgi:hypothetical protein